LTSGSGSQPERSPQPMNLNTAKRCIFCLRRGLTQEHVFADWLRVLFPRNASDTHTAGTTTWGKAKHGRIYAMPALRMRQGHSGSRKVRYVCGPCNNGWMSRMEARTRPILMPLIQGLPHRISTFDQQYLAAWVAKTVMVAEYLYPDRTAIPDLHRLWMYANLEPPPEWSIWMAHYSGMALSHHMCALHPAKPPGPGEVAPPDTQSTSIGMGHLFIQVLSTTVAGLEFGLDNETVLRRIWPCTNQMITWPPPRFVGDVGADFLAGTLARIGGIPSFM
jgi:hypothetical protein